MQSNIYNAIKELDDIANIGYFEADLVTGVWSGSDNIIKILGLNREQVYKNKDILELIHPDEQAAVLEYIKRSIDTETRLDYKYMCILPDGKKILMMTKSKILRNKNNKAVKIVGIKQDITSVKSFESKLKELKRMNNRKNEILGTVAHDLKSPLSSVKGMTEMLSENANSDQLDLIKYIQEALHTANDIINGLIEIAEIEEEKDLLHCEKADINEILKESADHFRIRAKKKGIEIKKELCPKAFAIVDSVKIARIVDNLILNAIKFTNKNGRILVASFLDAEDIKIIIEDNGIGIDTDIIPELFDKFSKARRKGTSGEKSTGLGLSIVKKLVELHKGSIDVESKVNVGSKFIVKIPSIKN